MMTNPLFEKLLDKLLRIKPTPLRAGKHTPFIYVHINKTAGTSVGRAIGLPVKRHLTAREIIGLIGCEKWDSAWKFTFVRNPWDRVVSLYEYRRRKDRTGIASNDLPFCDWVQRVFTDEPDPAYHNNPKSFQPQCEWLKDDSGKISVDFIGRFEHIERDFNRVAKEIGTSASLQHLNSSKRDDYHSYYDAGSRDAVARWFSEDIDRFGYTFGS